MLKKAGMTYETDAPKYQDQWSKLVGLIRDKIEARLGNATQADNKSGNDFDAADAVAKLLERSNGLAEKAAAAIQQVNANKINVVG
jgi:hypothetical protein